MGGDVCHTSRPGTPTRPGLAGGTVRLATPWRPVWETPAAPSRSGRGPCGVRPAALHSPCGRYAPCTRGARGGAAVRVGGRGSIGDGSRGLRPAGRPAARIGQLFAHRDGWGRWPWGGGLAPASSSCDAEWPAAGPGAGRGDRGPTSPRQTGGGEGQLGSERTGRSCR